MGGGGEWLKPLGGGGNGGKGVVLLYGASNAMWAIPPHFLSEIRRAHQVWEGSAFSGAPCTLWAILPVDELKWGRFVWVTWEMSEAAKLPPPCPRSAA